MEPVLFYGVPHGCSFGAIVALEWLGEPYRLARIDMLAKHDPRYQRINPHHETPSLLLEDGTVIVESLAIHQHIAARDLGRRLGFRQGTARYDALNRMMAYLHTSFHHGFAPFWAAYKLGQDAVAEKKMLRAMGQKATEKGYAFLDAHLAERDWLVGEHRTVADAYLAGIARWGEDLKEFDLTSYPHLHRHMKKLEADPALIFAHAIEEGRAAISSGQFRGEVSLDEIAPRLAA